MFIILDMLKVNLTMHGMIFLNINNISTFIFSFTNEMVLTDEHEQIGDIEFEEVI